MINIDLNGKTVMLTGATSVLGEQIAIQLGKSGASLILHYNSSAIKIENLEKKLKKEGCHYKTIKADFTKSEDIENLIHMLKERKCSIDVLINNAAIDISKFIITINDDDFDKLINVNLRAPYFLIKHVLRSMISKKNGCIVNISSSITKRSKIKGSLYGASKGGLEAMTKILAREIGVYNIRINSIAPGPFVSQMNKLNDSDAEIIQQYNAIPRLVSPEEISNAVIFLSSSLSSAITGQVIFVDNGFSI